MERALVVDFAARISPGMPRLASYFMVDKLA